MFKILRQYHKIFPRKFGSYWKKIEDYSKIDNDLVKITNSFINSESYNFVSRYWHILNIRAYEHLINKGYKDYGSTIAQNYFTMTDLYDPWIDKAMDSALDTVDIRLNGDIFKKQNYFTYRQSIFYNYLCILLYSNLKKTKYFDQLYKLQDKTYTGFDDPFIKIDNHKITTDKVVSLLDCEKINKAFNLDDISKILEIGAGSGRLADAILSLEANKKYVICDIPPAIFISYKRLQVAFPEKKISLLFDVTNKDELEKKINESDISFIFPHQLDLFSKNFIDLVLAVDCLHEMDQKTIQNYFEKINKLTNKFYFSVWDETLLPYSKKIFSKNTRLNYLKGDYNVPKNWDNIFKENPVFPSNYWCLGFDIKK